MPAVIDNPERHGHWKLETGRFPQREDAADVAGAMNHLLRLNRRQLYPLGRATTKPGTLLKSQIPIRRGTDRDGSTPGFLEVDLVAHCGSSAKGEFAFTLNTTDIKTGWTECQVVKNKARVHTLESMEKIELKLTGATFQPAPTITE